MSENRLVPKLVILFFIFASLACSLVTGIGEQITETKNTAEAVATDFRQGMDAVGTARAIITQVGGNNLLQTAQAAATELGDSGLLQTAQAVATEYGPELLNTARAAATEHPGLVETARAAVTQQAPGFLETARAVASDQAPGLLETARAAATQIAGSIGQIPGDIPLVDGQKDNLFSSDGLVTYFTALTFNEVLDFYKIHMPLNEWSKIAEGSLETTDTAVLIYDKPDRKAIVTLSVNPLDDHTIVLITITKK
jgi:hypothetical protein